jgi:biopolymer transport protein ExbB
MTEVWSFLVKGGVMMIPLAFCSVLGLAIIIERAIALRRKQILVPEIVSVIENIDGPEDFSLAKAICDKYQGPFANIIRVGLESRDLPREEVKETILDQGRQEIRELERGLSALETIAGVAPLLGLLGTVTGMIKVFAVISRIGVGQAEALSGGISEALITTAAGLSIGITALIAYNYFSNKAENLVLDIEKYSSQLLRKLRLVRDVYP